MDIFFKAGIDTSLYKECTDYYNFKHRLDKAVQTLFRVCEIRGNYYHYNNGSLYIPGIPANLMFHESQTEGGIRDINPDSVYEKRPIIKLKNSSKIFHTFKKLLGKIEQDIPKPTPLSYLQSSVHIIYKLDYYLIKDGVYIRLKVLWEDVEVPEEWVAITDLDYYKNKIGGVLIDGELEEF